MDAKLIDNPPENWIADWLQAYTNANVTEGQHLFLLLDAVFTPRLHQHLSRSRLLWVSAFVEEIDQALPYSPVLIDTMPSSLAKHAQSLETLLALTAGYPMLSMLESQANLCDTAAHLRGHAYVRAGEQNLALRFADTRILPLLAQKLNNEQRENFFGPITQWRYVGRDGLWHAVAHDAHWPLPHESQRLSLGDEQYAQIIDATAPDALLGSLSQDLRRDSGLAPSKQHALVVQAMARATALGVKAPNDMRACCVLGLISGHEVLDKPETQHAISNALAKGQPLHEGLAEFME